MHNRLLPDVRSIILKQRLFASGHADPEACRVRGRLASIRSGWNDMACSTIEVISRAAGSMRIVLTLTLWFAPHAFITE